MTPSAGSGRCRGIVWDPDTGIEQLETAFSLPDGGGGNTAFKLIAQVDASVPTEPFQDVTDVSEIEYTAHLSAILIEVGGSVMAAVEYSWNILVKCVSQSGHINSSYGVQGDPATGLPPQGFATVEYGGVNYVLRIVDDGITATGDHTHNVLAEAAATLTGGGVSRRTPAGNGTAKVTNTFKSRRIW